MTLTLAAASSVQGIAGTGTAVTYSIFGDELDTLAGTDSYRLLAQGQLPIVAGVLGSAVPANKAWIVKSVHLCNTTASPVAGVKVFAGGSAATNQLVTLTIPANGEAIYGGDGWRIYDASGFLLTTVGLTFTGDVTGSGTGTITTTISAGAVTYAKIQDQAQATFLMRAAGAGTGSPIAGTAAQAKTALAIVPADVTGFDTQVRTSRLDQMAAAGADVSHGGFRITSLGDGISATDAVNLGQLTAAVEGRKNKNPALYSTTGNVTLSGLGTQANGEWPAPLTAGQVVLAKDQSTSADKGLYTVAAGAWTRTADASTGPEITNASVLVLLGATLSGDTFTQTATVTTIGTDPQTWTQTGEGSTLTADGTTLQLVGLTLSVKPLGIGTASLENVLAAGGPIGGAAVAPIITWDAKGRLTAVTSAAITPAAIGAPSGSGTHSGTSSGTNTGDQTITLSGDVSGSGTAGITTTIGANKVTLAMMAQVATASFLGRITAATGNVEVLTGTQATTLLDLAVAGGAKGLISGTDKRRLDGLQYDAVADFGWVGNDSTDNLAAFNTMRAALPVGSRVWFPAGTYRVSGELDINVDKRIKFVGAGRYNTIIKTTSATANIFNVTIPAWYNTWEDLGFQATVTKTAGAALAITSGSAVGTNMYRCWITGLFRGIDANGSQSGNLSVWSDLDISGIPNGGRGIKIQGDTINVQIHNTTINAGAATTSACCEINQSGAVQVTSFDWIQGTNVLLINGTAGSGPQAVYLTNGFFDQPQGSVVKIIGTTTANRIKFTECGIAPTGNNYGVEINGTGGGAVGTSTALPAGISIVDCDIYSQNGTNTSAGVFLNGVGDVNIQNTRVTGFGGAGGCGIRCTPSATNQTKLRVNGCILGPNSNLTVTNTIGVQIDAGASALGFLSITDNSMSGSGTAIVDNSAVLSTAPKNINNNQGAAAGFSAQALPAVTVLTTVETVVLMVPLPPNAGKVGTTFQVTLAYKPAIATVITLRARIGTSDVTPATDTSLVAIADASSANGRFAQAQFTIASVGGAATFGGNGVINTSAVAQAVVNAAPAVTSSFNSAVQNYFIVTLTNTTSTTTTVQSGSVEVYSPA